MKFFKVLTVVSLFFFFIACEDGSQRFVPVDEVDDGSSEVTDDTDPTDPTEPTNPTDEPTNPTDEPTNPTDDPTNPTDEPTNPTDEPTNPTDEPTNPTDEPTNPTDPTVTDEEKCLAETGTTWDASSQSCYRIENCDTAAKPANSEWNGDSSYKVYYDVDTETWVPGPVYETQYGDGEPQPCQYKCVTKYGYDNGECKPYCSAVFDGTTSNIEVAANDALNLNSESKTWTIEAWIKQADADLTSDNVPIVRKGTGSTPVYLLTGYKKQTWGSNYASYSLMGYVQFSYPASTGIPYVAAGDGELTPGSNNTVNYSAEWSHVAMVQNAVTSGNNPMTQTTTYKLLLFLNGKQITSEEYKSSSNSGIGGSSSTSVVPTIKTNNEALVIGANLNAGLFFKGLIDSIKISNTAKYTAAFTPAKLTADDTTVAFWNFSGDATSSVGSSLDGTETAITYSTDCKE